MPKKYRNAWGTALNDHATRCDDRSAYVFTHDFDPSRLPEICESIRRSHKRVIDAQARESVITIVIRHRELSPRKGETQKQFLKRTHAEAASVLGVAFGAVGRYVERKVRSGNRRNHDRHRPFRPTTVTATAV